VTEPFVDAGALMRPDFDEAALYGLPGEIVRKLMPVTDADPAAMLAQTMTLLGNAIGGDVCVDFGGPGEQQHGNLFTLVVGQSRLGRKGTSYRAVSRLFEEADESWYENRILTGLSSPQALVARLAEPVVAEGVTPPPFDKRTLLLESEYQRLLSTMGRDDGAFSGVLRKLWAYERASVDKGTDPRKLITIKAARGSHVSMIAHITPQELRKRTNQVRRDGGLENRMLWVYSHKRPEPVPPTASSKLDLSDEIERLATVIDYARSGNAGSIDPVSGALCDMRGIRKPMVLRFSDELDDKLEALFAEAYQDHELGVTDDYRAMIVRLALIHAVADFSPVIEIHHVRAAIALWNYAGASASVILGPDWDDVTDALADATQEVDVKVSPRRLAVFFARLRDERRNPTVVTEGPWAGWVDRATITKGWFSDNLKNDVVSGGDAVIDKTGEVLTAMVARLAQQGVTIEVATDRSLAEAGKQGRPTTYFRMAV
jgi:hypothetical protein